MTHLLDETASGVYVIAVTPFTDAGSIDEQSIDRVVEFYLEKGVTGITILGAITPIGGVAMVSGWLVLAWSVWRR